VQVTRIMKRAGAHASHARPSAPTGDIVSLAGAPGVAIGDTLCAPEATARVEPGAIDPPTLSMVFAPNSSPIGRGVGHVVTAAKIVERLEAEAARSVSLRARPRESMLLSGCCQAAVASFQLLPSS
jgi:GTP-binding protein